MEHIPYALTSAEITSKKELVLGIFDGSLTVGNAESIGDDEI